MYVLCFMPTLTIHTYIIVLGHFVLGVLIKTKKIILFCFHKYYYIVFYILFHYKFQLNFEIFFFCFVNEKKKTI